MSQSNSNSNHTANSMRKIMVLSDTFTQKLIKGYVEPLSFSVKPLT